MNPKIQMPLPSEDSEENPRPPRKPKRAVKTERKVEGQGKPRHTMRPGERYGRLVSVSFFDKKNCHHRWLFDCDCGQQVVVKCISVRAGITKSCGCLHKELLRKRTTTHGHSKRGEHHREYLVHQGMKRRCYNPKAINFHDYGGRGIAICERWLNGDGNKTGFECFLEDMGSRPSAKHEIDRHPDNNGPYAPWNCRWATRKQGSNNKRSNRFFTINGITHTLTQWAEEYKMPEWCIKERLRIGWSIEDALTRPRHGYRWRDFR